MRAAAVATSNSAAALRERVTSLSRKASGKTVTAQLDILTKQAGIAEKTATNLTVVADALKIREAAAKTWNRDAPKDSEIKKAKKAVSDAKKALTDASTASGDTSAASSKLEAAHAGRVVLCGSHGALYPAWLAAKARVKISAAASSASCGSAMRNWQ